MAKASKKHTSRFFTEKDDLYETSDFATTFSPAEQRRQKRLQKAQEAEQRSHQKIVAVYAPVDTIKTEDEAPVLQEWDSYLKA
jgi:hypothetical protein